MYRPIFTFTTYIFLALNILATTAQDLSELPACAQRPALQSIQTTGCKLTDIPCICRDTAYTSALRPLIQQACSAEDYQRTLQFTQELCGGVGVTVGGSNASASASASVNATATGDGAASTAPPDSAAGETKGAGGLVVMLGLVMVGWLVVSG